MSVALPMADHPMIDMYKTRFYLLGSDCSSWGQGFLLVWGVSISFFILWLNVFVSQCAAQHAYSLLHIAHHSYFLLYFWKFGLRMAQGGQSESQLRCKPGLGALFISAALTEPLILVNCLQLKRYGFSEAGRKHSRSIVFQLCCGTRAQ